MSTQPLVIEYVFEGHRRGYNFTGPTRGVGDALLKTVWRQAMPRGQGWGAPQYIGARSLKCFPVSPRLVALSSVVVTDLADEGGRRGIRRAEISLMSADECVQQLKARLAAYPQWVQARLDHAPTLGQWKRILDEALPKLRRDAQVVVASPYSSAEAWQSVEALVIKLSLSRRLLLPRQGKVVPFTTLALDFHDESPLVAMPAAQMESANNPAPIRVFMD